MVQILLIRQEILLHFSLVRKKFCVVMHSQGSRNLLLVVPKKIKIIAAPRLTIR